MLFKRISFLGDKMDFIQELDGGFSIIENIKVSGAREGKYGVTVILAPNSTASAVFTTNKVVAAPVTYTKNVVKNLLINLKNLRIYLK